MSYRPDLQNIEDVVDGYEPQKREVRERPILFSAPMVRAILEGRKTQTRRLVKPQPHNPEVFGVSPIWGAGVRLGSDRFGIHCATNVNGKREDRWIECPYGQPGDGLWVRETLKLGKMVSVFTGQPTDADAALYAADGEPVLVQPGDFDAGWGWQRPTLPAIHMPRWASRITLEITDVRVERLQDISEEDAKAEGCSGTDPEPKNEGGTIFAFKGISSAPNPRAHFAALWESINGAGSWASNPWVWVVSFRPSEPHGGAR